MTEITFTKVDTHRVDASVPGRHLASAVLDNFGWAVHSRQPDGEYATVARVDEGLSPGLARSFALMKLHAAAASARLVGAA